MSDPLNFPGSGMVSPFVKDARTVETALDLLRDVRAKKFGAIGAPFGFEGVRPALRVLVRNDTGADLPALSVLELGDPLVSALDDPDADPPSSAAQFQASPLFPGTAPTSAGGVFVVTETPLSYVASAGSASAGGAIGPAVVMGVVPVDIDVSDEDHGFSRPIASTTANLESASGGPARIIWKESGTGVKRAVVLMQFPTDLYYEVAQSSGSYTFPDSNFNDIPGCEITVPTTGRYLVSAYWKASGRANTIGVGPIYGRIKVNSTDGLAVVLLHPPVVTTFDLIGDGFYSNTLELTAGDVVKLQGARLTPAGTWAAGAFMDDDTRLELTRI